MSNEINQWKIEGISGGITEYQDLPAGAPAPVAPGKVSLFMKHDALIDMSKLLARPGVSDDIAQGWSPGSIILASDGNFWLNTDNAAGAAKWRIITSPTDLSFNYGTSLNPGWVTDKVDYLSVPQFTFRGTTRMGVPISASVVAKAKKDDGGGQARLVDITNSTIIATTSTPFQNLTFQKIDLGTLSNLPANPAQFEFQIRVDPTEPNQDDITLESHMLHIIRRK